MEQNTQRPVGRSRPAPCPGHAAPGPTWTTSASAARKRALRMNLRSERSATAHRAPDEDARLAGCADDVIALGPRPLEQLRIAAFDPTPTEPDVRKLLRVLLARGHSILLPVHAGKRIDWSVWDGSSPLAPPPARGFGREPSGPREGDDALARTDLVLAPALAVDRSGTRQGHGGGYYDRALAHAPAAVVVAVVHPWELLAPAALPREAHDRPVHAALTTNGVERLRP